MWGLSPTADYERRHKLYAKKHPRELRAILANLEKYFQSLQEGGRPSDIKAGFIHPEPRGIIAIDQKGGGSSLAETRLYAYPDDETETLYLVTLGDKRSQADDIQEAKRFVERLRNEREHEQNDE